MQEYVILKKKVWKIRPLQPENVLVLNEEGNVAVFDLEAAYDFIDDHGLIDAKVIQIWV